MENKKDVQSIEFKFKSGTLRKQTLATGMETPQRDTALELDVQECLLNPSRKRRINSFSLKVQKPILNFLHLSLFRSASLYYVCALDVFFL